jgi:hypothetical protein
MRGYPEPGYGEYRGEWDAYERDRAWATYERERQAMEYGRRGRSRSPGMDDGGSSGIYAVSQCNNANGRCVCVWLHRSQA